MKDLLLKAAGTKVAENGPLIRQPDTRPIENFSRGLSEIGGRAAKGLGRIQEGVAENAPYVSGFLQQTGRQFGRGLKQDAGRVADLFERADRGLEEGVGRLMAPSVRLGIPKSKGDLERAGELFSRGMPKAEEEILSKAWGSSPDFVRGAPRHIVTAPDRDPGKMVGDWLSEEGRNLGDAARGTWDRIRGGASEAVGRAGDFAAENPILTAGGGAMAGLSGLAGLMALRRGRGRGARNLMNFAR